VEKDDGYISPGEFIPLAEATGLIIELGRFALEKALEDQNGSSVTLPKPFPTWLPRL